MHYYFLAEGDEKHVIFNWFIYLEDINSRSEADFSNRLQSAAPLFARSAGPAPCFVCGARIGQRARGPRQRPRAHSSVHLGVGPRILLATREISPFSSCLQCGYKSGIFFITSFFKKLHLGSFFVLDFSTFFPPSCAAAFWSLRLKIFYPECI